MARKRTENAADYSEEIKTGGQCTRAKKYMKRTNEQLHESGRHTYVSGGREEKSPSQAPSPTEERLTHLKDPAQEVPILEIHSGKLLQPSGKLKLQLFPVDDHTREGLQKDGLHPYLELTLSSRKKISSVLKHIHSKWGGSQIAQGEPVLYPYDKLVHIAGYKWTANSSFAAGDVYAAIGAPAVFRLRYGWTAETEDKTSEAPSLPYYHRTDFRCEGTQKSSSDKGEGTIKQIGEGDNLSTLSSEEKATNPTVSERILPDGQVQSKDDDGINDCSGPTLFPWDDLTNLSIGGLLSEASLRATNLSKSSNGETPTLWVDNLTNISIGGLLSEASLHGRLNKSEHESDRNDAGLQENTQPKASVGGLLSESSMLGRFSDLDKAWNVSGSGKPQGSCAAGPSEPRSSILDAEDTCHAFSFGNNLSSQRKKCTATTSTNKCQDSASSVSILVKGMGEDEGMREKAKSECGKQPLTSSTLFGQESSLGLSSIKWADSMGPFDMGLSSFEKFTSGDSVSFGALVKSMQKAAP